MQPDFASGGSHIADQWADPDDPEHALHVVGQHMEAHFGGDFVEGTRQEMRGTHPGFQCSKRVFDGRASILHHLWLGIDPALAVIEDLFMIPAAYSS